MKLSSFSIILGLRASLTSQEGEDVEIIDPTSKKEWHRYRGQFENTAAMNFKFFQDPLLPVRLRMLVLGGRFLHYDYAEMNRMMETTENRAKYVADRANCSVWPDTICPMLQSRNDANVWHKLGLKPKQAVPINPDSNAPWFEMECGIVAQYCEFISESASELLWDQLPFSMTFPLVLGAMNLKDANALEERCQYMARLARACEKAEK